MSIMKPNTMAFAKITRHESSVTPRALKPRTFPVLASALITFCSVACFSSHARATDNDTLNSDDVKFVKEAAADNMAEVTLGELGVKKASSSEVKKFAEMIVKDHGMASEELKKLATIKGVDVSAGIEPKQAEKIQGLEKLIGADFDKNFVAVMVSDHKADVSNFEKASANSKDANLKAWVDKMIPTLKAHLSSAQQLNGEAKVAGNASHAVNDSSAPDNTERNTRDRNDATLTPFDQGSSKNDTEITAQIRRGIRAEKNLSTNAQNVKIITINGKVTLRGPVNNNNEKALIGKIAKQSVHANNVDSQLEVK